MRKIYLAVASSIALVAFIGFSTTAFAVVDSSCDGSPYDNTFAVHDFTIDTPDSNVPGGNSGVNGAGLACGTDISGSLVFGEGGVASMNDRAVIANPPGVTVNAVPSTDIPDGSYVGSSVINIAAYACGLFGDACIKQNEPITLRADDPAGTDCPADALACYDGVNDNGLGHAWIWVEEDADGRTELTIGRFHPVIGVNAGLTDIKSFDLCAYAGANSCGDGSNPDAFVQKNGDPSVITTGTKYNRYMQCGRYKGNGIYRVRVQNKGGAWTPSVSTCVDWVAPSCSSVKKKAPHSISGNCVMFPQIDPRELLRATR